MKSIIFNQSITKFEPSTFPRMALRDAKEFYKVFKDFLSLYRQNIMEHTLVAMVLFQLADWSVLGVLKNHFIEILGKSV